MYKANSEMSEIMRNELGNPIGGNPRNPLARIQILNPG